MNEEELKSEIYKLLVNKNISTVTALPVIRDTFSHLFNLEYSQLPATDMIRKLLEELDHITDDVFNINR